MDKVSNLAANFERKMRRRVVITGHGSYRDGDGMITVPAGKVIHFYVAHGVGLANDVGMAVEGLDGGKMPQPFESVRAGQRVHNYILTYASGLTLNGSQKNAQFDWVTVSHPGQAVPLSVLLNDSRCQTATEIHWAACRSQANWLGPSTHDAGYSKTAATYAK